MNCAPIQVLLFAGYDTTGITLGYVAYLLALHPETQDRLRDAVDRAFEDNGGEMPGYTTIQVQGDPSSCRLGYVDINSVSFRGYPQMEWSQHNPVRKQMGHPV